MRFKKKKTRGGETKREPGKLNKEEDTREGRWVCEEKSKPCVCWERIKANGG